MKIKLLILSLLLSANLFAQKMDDIKYGLYLRGKILGGFFIEDYWIMTATAGLEYRVHKNFSFGTDFVHVNEVFEKEHYYDSTNYDVYNEYAQKNPRSCLLTDLRFYPFHKKYSAFEFEPYIAAFSKYGSIITWCAPGYNFSNEEVVRRRGTFLDLGITVGFHSDFGKGNFGLDFNLGYCRRFETSDIEYHNDSGTNRFVYDEYKVKDRLAGRLNLYFILFSKKNIAQ